MLPIPAPPQQRSFLPHLPPSLMRYDFGSELVPRLPHLLRLEFPLETDLTDGISLPPSSSPRALPLIPKPPGEVGRVGRGGYTLKDVLEQQHEWEDGLYLKIRVGFTQL